MNLDELATNVARDIGAVRQRSCKRADGVEYHFEQSELEQFAKELITEYEKTVNSEPAGSRYRTAKHKEFACLLTDEDWNYGSKNVGLWQCSLEENRKYLSPNDISKHDFTEVEWLYLHPDPRVAELEAKLQQMNSLCEFNERTMSDIASKYEALEAQNSALLVAIEAKDAAMNSVLTNGYGVWVLTQLGNAINISPSTELLEARDRVRDAKLLRIIEQRIQPQDSYQDDYFKAKVHSYNIVNELIKQRESGEWKPELGD